MLRVVNNLYIASYAFLGHTLISFNLFLTIIDLGF